MRSWWKRTSGSADATAGRPPAEDLRCSFCNKAQADVRKLIAGPTVFICDECVEVCVDIMADDPEWQRLPQESLREPAAQRVSRPLAKHAVLCSLCGQTASIKQVLPIKDRGVLCGGCADAVEDALAHGTPAS